MADSMPLSCTPNEFVFEWLRNVQSSGGTNSAANHAAEQSQGQLINPLHTNDPSAKYNRKLRHKTKDDRYDYKGIKNRTPKRVKREHTAEGEKSRKRSAEELQNAFKAPDLIDERLTLRPQGLGFLQKGRSSETVVRRELPDLTFSEMTFLKKERDLSAPHFQRLKALQRSENDRIHAEQISKFFAQPQDCPQLRGLHEAECNLAYFPSYESVSDDPYSTRRSSATVRRTNRQQVDNQELYRSSSPDLPGAQATIGGIHGLYQGQKHHEPLHSATSCPSDTRGNQGGTNHLRSTEGHLPPSADLNQHRSRIANQPLKPFSRCCAEKLRYSEEAMDKAPDFVQDFNRSPKRQNASCENYCSLEDLRNLAGIVDQPWRETTSNQIDRSMSSNDLHKHTTAHMNKFCIAPKMSSILPEEGNEPQDKQYSVIDVTTRHAYHWAGSKTKFFHSLQPDHRVHSDLAPLANTRTGSMNDMHLMINADISGYSHVEAEQTATIDSHRDLSENHATNVPHRIHEHVPFPDLVLGDGLSPAIPQYQKRSVDHLDAFDQGVLMASSAWSPQAAVGLSETILSQLSLPPAPKYQVGCPSTPGSQAEQQEEVRVGNQTSNLNTSKETTRPQLLRPSLCLETETLPFDGFTRPWVLY